MKSDYLKVSETHQLYYEVCGESNSEPILFIHGGPGVGFSENDKRFFDFNKHKVIFFDQRGASKSIPFGCIEENTTQDLINDINLLLKHLQVDKVMIFGGSWGTTLGLAYTIQNPHKVTKMLLRGLFLGNDEANQHYLGGGVANEYPDIWNRFKNNVPNDSPLSISKYYLEKMKNGTENEKKHFIYEWAFYEISIFKNGITKTEVEKILSQFPYESLSIMEAHFLGNDCFLEDNYILNNSNVLKNIPIKIVHGKDDAICPLKLAIQFDEKTPSSELFVLEGGHSDYEPEIETKLIELINNEVW